MRLLSRAPKTDLWFPRVSSDLQFPTLDALAARLVEEGAETLRFEIDAPVLVLSLIHI